MKKFLKLKTKVYRSTEYNNYLKSIDDSELDEADAWKAELKKEVGLPVGTTAEVRVDPDKVVAYIETSSLESWAANPDKPKNDCLDIYLEDGLVITVNNTLKEFEKLLENIYNER